MTRRTFAIACCLLLSATSMFAQSGRADSKADPISGIWKGELVLKGGSQPVAITMVLTFDGKSAVSGTFTGLPNPGDVKAGTFEAKTGKLKLHLGKTGESAVLLILDGTVVKGIAAGTFTGDESGEFKLAKS